MNKFRIWSFKCLLTLILVVVGTACTPSSDTSFGNILGSTDGGGVGSASIAINSFLPSTANVTIKAENTETFMVSAVGDGTLTYAWTLDGIAVGTNNSQYILDATSQTVGVKTLKVSIGDKKGSVSQTWTVKINGTPTLTSSTPIVSSVGVKQGSTINFSVTFTDPNSDTLTYTWKLNGNESVITSTTANASYTPSAIDVGSHTVSVTVRDGAVSDAGTYTVTKSWSLNVNNFYNGCNDMENDQLTNRSCVYTGIANLGNELNPDSFPQSISIRPTAVVHTSDGNLFISDNLYHVVWFWNRTSSPVTVVGITVPANSMKIVAGAGATGAPANSSSTLAVRNHLNSPQGLLYDGTDLYISDTSNNIVRKVNSSNVITTVLGGGASNTDGAAANTHICSSPYGLAKYGNDLFVSCGGIHRVKRVDLTTGFAYTLAGTGTAGNAVDNNESTPTDANNGKLNLPYGLAVDTSGNLYIGEYNGCRVRFINRTASTVTLFGSYTIGAGKMRTIVGTAAAASCSYATGEAVNLTAAADARVDNPRLLFYYNNTLFIAQHTNHSVAALNLSGSTKTFGSTSIPSYNVKTVFGNSTGGYLGEGSQAIATRFNTPFGLSYEPVNDEYIVADYANLRVRKVKSNFTTELIAGNGATSRLTNGGNGDIAVDVEKMNSPRELAYDGVTGELFFADTSNQRIRKVNKYGVVSTAVGLGTLGSGAEENEVPTNVTMNQPMSLTLVGSTSTFGGHLVYTDNSNHRVRFWNRSTSNVTYFGILIEAGKVATIAGVGTSGNTTSGPAISASLNAPEGLAFDGTNLYVSDRGNHCIKKINSTGDISVAAGTCGTAGNVNGAVGTGRLNNPRGLSYYENGAQKGVFIADTSNSRVKFMRLGGTAPIAGVPVSAGDTNNVACGGTYHDDGIISSNSICNTVYTVTVIGGKFCFTNYGYHNARCVDISSGMISTVMGPLQGIDSSQPKFFPGTAFSLTDQNNVTAATGTADPALGTSFGMLNFPLGITTDKSSRLFIGEWGSATIRKVILP